VLPYHRAARSSALTRDTRRSGVASPP
jgi:hypothetical protein